MTNDSTNSLDRQSEAATAGHLLDDWFDPIEAGLRERVREFIQTMIESELEPHHRRETFIPHTFELVGDKPIIGVDCVILPARTRRFVTGLFEGEFTQPQPFRTGSLAIRNQLQCSIESQWRDYAQDLR